MSDFQTLLGETIRGGTCLSLVLSKRRGNADANIDKLTMRPVLIKGQQQYQLTAHAAGRQTHENLDAEPAIERIESLFGSTFGHAHLFTPEADFSARRKRGGSVRIKKNRPSKQPAAADHDRAKTYLIPENVPCPFLAEIGVMNGDGKVRAAKYPKFRQINRFLELVDDVLKHLPADGRLNVVDFGSGKSYLTFALHHLLTVIHNREVDIVGLDRNPEIMRDCSKIADKLGLQGLQFHAGDIADHESADHIHLAVSLHACDTATDAALAKAVAWQTDVILAVPCCQHELAGKIPTDALEPILQHGILRDRQAALVTDALRAKALEICGYKTSIVEFIDMEHTAKNVLIRAIRGQQPDTAEHVDAYRRLKQQFGLNELYLESAFGTAFTDQLAGIISSA